MIQRTESISFTGHSERTAVRHDHYDSNSTVLPLSSAGFGATDDGLGHSAHPERIHIRSAIGARLQGPGGYYNIGNAIGLASGLIFQIAASRDVASGEQGAGGMIGSYLFGSPSATALTVATAIFFASGEFYHRAFQPAGGEPDRKRLLQADLLSGVGAVCLAIALLLLGSVWLALASTLLLAGGKFGNALAPAREWRFTIGSKTLDAFRVAPALSRVPAMVALAAALAWAAVTASGDPSQHLQAGILLLCYCLWFRADLLLLRA